MLCINGDWYEVHAAPGCNTMGDQQYVPCETYNEDENEAYASDFESDSDSKLKYEMNDCNSSNDKDYNTFDTLSIFEPHIEVNTLPPLIQSLAKLKTITISRTKAKKSVDAITKHISHRKELTVIKSTVSQVDRIQKIKRPCNQTVFMDHRPSGACKCDVCQKTLANFSTLRNHILHQHCLSKRTERVSCSECPRTFSSKGNLKLHKRLHLKSKEYVCSYCGRGFNQIAGLREHTNQHTGK